MQELRNIQTTINVAAGGDTQIAEKVSSSDVQKS